MGLDKVENNTCSTIASSTRSGDVCNDVLGSGFTTDDDPTSEPHNFHEYQTENVAANDTLCDTGGGDDHSIPVKRYILQQLSKLFSSEELCRGGPKDEVRRYRGKYIHKKQLSPRRMAQLKRQVRDKYPEYSEEEIELDKIVSQKCKSMRCEERKKKHSSEHIQ